MSSMLVSEISKFFDLEEEVVIKLIRSAPLRYKVYKIPKRKPGEFRIIAQPAKEVKILQYWMIDNYLKHLPVHKSALAYVPKRNIKDNAIIHVNSNYILKMDFEKYFPSIKPKDFRFYMESFGKDILSSGDIDYAVNILFWKPKNSYGLELSIGAPSSPLISNILMFEFDNKVEAISVKHNVNYSRYADDLTFSTKEPKLLNIIYNKVETICGEIKFPSLKINEHKTIYSSKKHRRRVTGLILTNDDKVSLGRDRKRSIRVKIYQFINGNLSMKEALQLKGLIAFAISVEPSFVDKMRIKYGGGIIRAILKTNYPLSSENNQ